MGNPKDKPNYVQIPKKQDTYSMPSSNSMPALYQQQSIQKFNFVRSEDYDKLNDIQFEQKYNTSKHRYRYDHDPMYRKYWDQSMQETTKKYGSIDYPSTSSMSKRYEGNPNTAFMYPNLNSDKQAQKQQEDISLNVIGSVLPIPGINSMKPLQTVNAIKEASTIAKVIDPTIQNLEHLKYAKEMFSKYGYDIPENLETVAKSSAETDKVIKGLVDQHNTFVRGVSTNWDEIEKRNPEILRHLEGKGIDWKNNPQAAAEYMATHVPIQTGYGRSGLNKEVFDKGLDGLYTSNSVPTAEGYTYGQGYVVKTKKPTDYSSANRKDWIDKNVVDYHEHTLPYSGFEMMKRIYADQRENALNSLSRLPKDSEIYPVINDYVNKMIKDEDEMLKSANLNAHEDAPFKLRSDGTRPASKEVTDFYERMNKYRFNEFDKLKPILDKPIEYKPILKTEHNTAQRDIFINAVNKHFPKNNLSVNEDLHNIASKIRKESSGTVSYNKDILPLQIEHLKKLNPAFELPQIEPNQYAHYIHLGTPGEKILEPIESTRITPEIWQNKSRAHTNSYTKGLSAASLAPVVVDQLKDNGQSEQTFNNGGTMKYANHKQGPSQAKAEEMMHDGTVNGHKLTPKKKRYFGMLAHPQHVNGGLVALREDENFTYPVMDSPYNRMQHYDKSNLSQFYAKGGYVLPQYPEGADVPPMEKLYGTYDDVTNSYKTATTPTGLSPIQGSNSDPTLGISNTSKGSSQSSMSGGLLSSAIGMLTSVGQAGYDDTHKRDENGLINVQKAKTYNTVNAVLDPASWLTDKINTDWKTEAQQNQDIIDKNQELRNKTVWQPYNQQMNKQNTNYGYVYPFGGITPNAPANAEIEREEVLRAKDGTMAKGDLPDHADATQENQVNLEGGTKIYSDRLKIAGSKVTYAKQADVYKKVIEKNEDNLKAIDSYTRNTAMRKTKYATIDMDKLFTMQEDMKKMEGKDTQSMMANGGEYNENLYNSGRVLNYDNANAFNGVDPHRGHVYAMGGVSKYYRGDLYVDPGEPETPFQKLARETREKEQAASQEQFNKMNAVYGYGQSNYTIPMESNHITNYVQPTVFKSASVASPQAQGKAISSKVAPSTTQGVTQRSVAPTRGKYAPKDNGSSGLGPVGSDYGYFDGTKMVYPNRVDSNLPYVMPDSITKSFEAPAVTTPTPTAKTTSPVVTSSNKWKEMLPYAGDITGAAISMFSPNTNPKYKRLTPEYIDPRINVDNQLNQIRGAQREANNTIRSNYGPVTRANAGNIQAKTIEGINNVYANKNQIEVGLRNENQKIKFAVSQYNNQLDNQERENDAKLIGQRMTDIQRHAASMSNIYQNQQLQKALVNKDLVSVELMSKALITDPKVLEDVINSLDQMYPNDPKAQETKKRLQEQYNKAKK